MGGGGEEGEILGAIMTIIALGKERNSSDAGLNDCAEVQKASENCSRKMVIFTIY